ncbi:hypothetical protein DFH27DRAFT_607924 [Peziza echinospora]|nr:hypothetical protein DFH27DRAFT_607924 [Peziza echinospora]
MSGSDSAKGSPQQAKGQDVKFPCLVNNDQCLSTGKTYRTFGDLKADWWRHSRPFQCVTCYKRYGKKGDLTKHKKSPCLFDNGELPLTPVELERIRKVNLAQTHELLVEAVGNSWVPKFLEEQAVEKNTKSPKNCQQAAAEQDLDDNNQTELDFQELPEMIPVYLDQEVSVIMLRRYEGYYDPKTIDPAVILERGWGFSATPSVSPGSSSCSNEDTSDEDMK